MTAVRSSSDANSKRNSWTGHVGAVGNVELVHRVNYLVDRLEESRQLLGSAWRDLPFVRAGSGRKRQGTTHQTVELAVGPNAPFRQDEFEVGDLMEEGELYLCADGALQPLPLQHLVVLRSAPSSAQYTCYFYNRRDGDQVRLVAYQLADQSEVTENVDAFAVAIAGLVGPSVRSTLP